MKKEEGEEREREEEEDGHKKKESLGNRGKVVCRATHKPTRRPCNYPLA